MQAIKASDLTGLPLDWAVAKAMGLLDSGRVKLRPYGELWCYRPAVAFNPTPQVYYSPDYSPSTKWDDAGHVIDIMNSFGCFKNANSTECTSNLSDESEDGIWVSDGPTKLIALMRCFVTSKLGEEIEIPEELIGFSIDS